MTTDGARQRLDSWKFWMGVAYFGIAATVVGLYVLFAQQTNERTKRVASQRAFAQAQVSQCRSSVVNAPVVAGFIAGQRALIVNSLISNQAAIDGSRPDDPLKHVREAAIVRLNKALTVNIKLQDLVVSTTPSKQKCNLLAKSVGVKLPFPHARRK